MPIANNVLFEDGDIPTAAELNTPYDEAATVTQNLDDENTADNWITIAHVGSNTQLNSLYDFTDTANTSFSTSSTSYVTVNNTALSEVSLGYSPDQYEILRVEAGGLQSNSEVEQTYDSTAVPPNGNRNYYAFRLLLTYNDGAGSLTKSLGEWGYTFTSMTGGSDRYYTATNGLPQETGVPLAYQTFQFSTCEIYNGAGGTRTYEKIELQCKVNYSGNILRISRNNIIVVRARR